jgi:hypothetical protein
MADDLEKVESELDTTKWDILEQVVKDIGIGWGATFSRVLTFKWNASQRITKAVTLKWNIFEMLARRLACRWIMGGLSFIGEEERTLSHGKEIRLIIIPTQRRTLHIAAESRHADIS